MAKDLWPDFDLARRPKTVRQILLDAGSGITNKTDGRISFVVDTSANGDQFIHDCYLSAPSIGFRYPLMKVVHKVEQFPATLVSDVSPRDQKIVVKNENELVNALADLFHSEPTGNVVTQLLSASS